MVLNELELRKMHLPKSDPVAAPSMDSMLALAVLFPIVWRNFNSDQAKVSIAPVLGLTLT